MILGLPRMAPGMLPSTPYSIEGTGLRSRVSYRDCPPGRVHRTVSSRSDYCSVLQAVIPAVPDRSRDRSARSISGSDRPRARALASMPVRVWRLRSAVVRGCCDCCPFQAWCSLGFSIAVACASKHGVCLVFASLGVDAIVGSDFWFEDSRLRISHSRLRMTPVLVPNS